MKRLAVLATGLLLVLGLVALFLTGCAGTPAATPTPVPTATVAAATATPAGPTPTAPAAGAPGAVANGQQLFLTNCAVCHGTNGAGGMTVGNATSADLRQSALEPKYHNDPALLRRAILDGMDEEGQPLDSAMPRFRGKLSDQDVNDIIAYLQTLK